MNNPKREMTITIKGGMASGKSTVAHTIKNLLDEHGISNFIIDQSPEIRMPIPDTFDYMKKNVKVEIRTSKNIKHPLS